MSASNNFGQRTDVPYHGGLAGEAQNAGTGGASFGQHDRGVGDRFGSGNNNNLSSDASTRGIRNEPGVIGIGGSGGGLTGNNDNLHNTTRSGTGTGIGTGTGVTGGDSSYNTRSAGTGTGVTGGDSSYNTRSGAQDPRTTTQKTKDAYNRAKEGAKNELKGEGHHSNQPNTGYQQQTLASESDGTGYGSRGGVGSGLTGGTETTSEHFAGGQHSGVGTTGTRSGQQATAAGHHSGLAEEHTSKAPRNPEQEVHGVPDTRTTGEKIKDQFHKLTGGTPPARQPHGEKGQEYLAQEASKKGWNKQDTKAFDPQQQQQQHPSDNQGRLGESNTAGGISGNTGNQQYQSSHTTNPSTNPSHSTHSNISNKNPELTGY